MIILIFLYFGDFICGKEVLFFRFVYFLGLFRVRGMLYVELIKRERLRFGRMLGEFRRF